MLPQPGFGLGIWKTGRGGAGSADGPQPLTRCPSSSGWHLRPPEYPRHLRCLRPFLPRNLCTGSTQTHHLPTGVQGTSLGRLPLRHVFAHSRTRVIKPASADQGVNAHHPQVTMSSVGTERSFFVLFMATSPGPRPAWRIQEGLSKHPSAHASPGLGRTRGFPEPSHSLFKSTHGGGWAHIHLPHRQRLITGGKE